MSDRIRIALLFFEMWLLIATIGTAVSSNMPMPLSTLTGVVIVSMSFGIIVRPFLERLDKEKK